MRILPAIAIGVVAAALAGAANAGASKTNVMNVPLPDGSVARVEYVGDVAPKVTVAPRTMAALGDWGPQAMPFPSFAGFDRMIEQMQRQSREMIQRAQDMSRHTSVASPYIAAYGDMPAGQTSTTVVTISNNGRTCTRSTEVVSQGPGKPPKVTSNASGQCEGAGAAPTGPIHRT